VLIAITGFYNSLIKHVRMPFSADVALVAIGFYGLAHVYKDLILNINIKIPVVLFLIAFGFASSRMNGRIDMCDNVYGSSCILFTVSALSTIMLVCEVSKRMATIKFIQYVGRSSLLLFVLQPFGFLFTDVLRLRVFDTSLSPLCESNVILSVLESIIAIAVLLPVVRVLEKRLPSISGK